MAVGICCCYEEHRAALDEGAIFVSERRAHCDLVEAIGQGTRLAQVLKSAHPIVVQVVDRHLPLLDQPWFDEG